MAEGQLQDFLQILDLDESIERWKNTLAYYFKL